MGASRKKIGEQEPALSVSELVLVYEHLTVKLDSHRPERYIRMVMMCPIKRQGFGKK